MTAVQTRLDFSPKVSPRETFIATRRTMAELHPGTHANVLRAIKAIVDRDGTVDADRVRELMEAEHVFPSEGRRNMIGAVFGSLAGNCILERRGSVKSKAPRRKGAEIKLFIPGIRWHELAYLA